MGGVERWTGDWDLLFLFNQDLTDGLTGESVQ